MELRKVFFNRRAAFFSTDALIALVIILFVIIAVRPLSDYVQPDTEIHSDILTALSTLKVSELDDVTVQSMISSGVIRNPDKTLLEQIGEFYVYNTSNAKLLANIALKNLNTTENVGIWYGDELIFSSNQTPYEEAHEVDVARQVISGIEAGQNISGYAARAFLSSDWVTNYYYFGGYVGDGNLSTMIYYQGNISDEVEIEMAISEDFDLYINGAYYDHFVKNRPSPYEPEHYTIENASDYFSEGDNILEFGGQGLFIAGGFVKVNYRGDAQLSGKNKTYYFPGVDGLINVYDGFFVPNNLTQMEISLHMNSNYTAFLNIGNVSVYQGATDGEETIFLDNGLLSGLIDYGSLEGKTTPLRLGLENASYLGIAQDIDVFSVTDLSGSMRCSETGSVPGHYSWGCYESQSYCTSCGGTWLGPISSSQDANHLLVDIILNNTGNRVGLAGYRASASDSDFHELSNDSASLDAEIDSWWADGSTCICCGINKAMEGFLDSQQVNKPGRLLVYYDFNNGVGASVADKSGLGNDGAVSGNPTSAVGIGGNSFNLDGSGDYITIPDILDSDEGTFSIWVDSEDDTDRTILDASNPTEYFYLELDNQRDLRFQFEDADGTDFDDAEYRVSDIDTRGWAHLVGVWRYEGGTPSVELYLDGVLVDTDVDPADVMPNFLAPRIGRARSSGSGEDDFDGKIDEFRIYSKALTLAEIRGLNKTNAVCGNGVTEVGEVCDGDAQFCESGGEEGLKECNSGCNGFLACDTTAVCGDGLIQSGEECDDGNTDNHDGCSNICEIEERYWSIVVMSDGWANVECAEQGWTPDLNGNGVADDAGDDAIQASIDACEDYGVVVHAVGLGDAVDTETMIAIAEENGCGGNYYYSDATNLSNVYEQIANTILTDYVEQTLYSEGGVLRTVLYPDSYIKFEYDDIDVPYGLLITAEKDFDDAFGGSFYIPPGAIPVITNIVSYSGALWTSGAFINGQSVFNLSEYGLGYIYLGDPYHVTVADSVVVAGAENTANVTLGVSKSNQTSSSSADNKIVYLIVQNISSFSDILPVAQGCSWDLQLEDDSYLLDINIPEGYSGTDDCLFDETTYDAMSGSNDYGHIVNHNDAYQVAALNLLRALDLNDNGKGDVPFTEQDLEITLSEIEGIPFTYYTEVQARRWR